MESQNRYTFDVDPRLTKIQIRKFIETVYKVSVLSVNTHKLPRKKKGLGSFQGLKSESKRAIITLNKKDSLPFLNQ